MTNQTSFGEFVSTSNGIISGLRTAANPLTGDSRDLRVPPMMDLEKQTQQRVLIVSTHALFGNGLRSLLRERWSDQVTVVGMVSGLDEAIEALETLRPDLAIIDYDDDGLNREAFLTQFWSGTHPLRVVLLSLKAGREGAEATVYDRRTMAASQIDEWLNAERSED